MDIIRSLKRWLGKIVAVPSKSSRMVVRKRQKSSRRVTSHHLKSSGKVASKLPISSGNSRIFVISDLHLGHSNIIRYCNRPFKNSAIMDRELAKRWNNAVTKSDCVYFLGDFVWKNGSIGYYKTHLNGKKTFIRGNHDQGMKGLPKNKIIEYKGYHFYLVHNPAEIPPNWHGWCIYGHKHNSNLARFPFIDGERKRINVSVEVIDYRPLNLDYLISLNLPTIRRKKTLHSPTEHW